MTLSTIITTASLLLAAPPSSTPAPAPAKAAIGMPAPNFTLTDIDGKKHSLKDHKGRIVVLEWFNAGCPYSGANAKQSIHASKRASALRKDLKAVDSRVVYLIIDSTARNKTREGLIETNQAARTQWQIDAPMLIDFDGTVGRAYQARTTPHMYVIDSDGVLRYHGAFDDNKQRRSEDSEKPSQNHVLNAVTQIKAGNTPSPAKTKPWGCGVKYK